MTDESVSVLLNAYRRPDALTAQLDTIAAQSIPVADVHIWQNGSHFDIPRDVSDRCTVARCSSNLGVWARLAYALNLSSQYILLLDDDTFPGTRWIENCLATMAVREGLLGTRGMRFRSPLSYHHADDVGWRAPNEHIERVDIVGHAWFFRSEWLRAFWSEPKALPNQTLKGEDIHFSFALQKKLGLGTYVPPHPVDSPDLWGSSPALGELIGTDAEAISVQSGAMDDFQEVYRAYIRRGFQLCAAGSRRDDALAVAASMVRGSRFQSLQARIPMLGAMRRQGARRFGANRGSGIPDDRPFDE